MQSRVYVIAIVDDDCRVVESLENLLESAGHTPRGFASAKALMGSTVWDALDLLITDIDMPGIDGFELYAQLASAHPNVPAILITGRADMLVSARRRVAPGVAVFYKPFDANQLLDAIRERLGR